MPARKRARGAIALLLAALLLLGSVPPVFADTDLDLGGTAIVANTGGDAILLRTGAGYDFYVLSHVPPGTAVTVLDGPVYGDEGNPWYKVDVNGSTGYLFAAFLVRPEVAPAAPVVKAAATQGGGDTLAVVGTGGDGLRLRDGADLAAAILTVVPEGGALAVTGAPRLNGGQTWYPVQYGGVSGWAVADYLGASGSGAATPATNQAALALTIGEHVMVSDTGGWDLRLRATHNLDAGVIAAAPEGAVLRVLDGPLTDDGGNVWYGVSYDGIAGYASGAYLTWTDAQLTSRQAGAGSGAGAGAGSAGLGSGGNAAVSNTGGWPLRIRADVGTETRVVAVLRILDGPVCDGGGVAWYGVDYDGLAGYVSASYLSATSEAPSARQPYATASVAAAATSGASLGAGTHVMVGNTGGWPLRIRESTGLDGAVYGAADEGTVLSVLYGPELDSEGNAWYAVDYDGLSGFARASYLNPTSSPLSARAITPVAAAAAAPAPAPAVAQAAAPEPQPTPAPAAPAPAPAAPPAQPVAQTGSATGSFIYPAKGTFTQGFGARPEYYRPGGHNGIDIANSLGTPVVASDGGVVVYAGWKGGLGNAVVIDHGDGRRTEYGHGSAIHVAVGQRVQQGQTIMSMGSTGNSTGPHVHFSIIINGVYVDPMRFLR